MASRAQVEVVEAWRCQDAGTFFTRKRLDRPAYLSEVLERIPTGRVGTIGDVASAAVYLASEPFVLVTGTVLPVDGGWTAQ